MNPVTAPKIIRVLFISVLVWFASLSLVKAQAPTLVETNMTIMLNAVKDGVYGSFIAAGGIDFKETFTQESFQIVSEQLSPRLIAGYDIRYLESLNTQGYVVFLWKLSFADGGDDGLLSISVQDGFVVGFLMQ